MVIFACRMKRHHRTLASLVVVIVFALLVIAGAQEGMGNITPNETAAGMNLTNGNVTPQQNIVEIVNVTEDLSTLNTALEGTPLFETLQGSGPFTVFAPTDAAFDSLPAETRDALLQNASRNVTGQQNVTQMQNVTQTQNQTGNLTQQQNMTQQQNVTQQQNMTQEQNMTGILLYHVVAGNYSEMDLTNLTTLQTLQGENITIGTADGNLTVNNATVERTIPASNGFVHIIDAVLMPGEANVTPNETPPSGQTANVSLVITNESVTPTTITVPAGSQVSLTLENQDLDDERNVVVYRADNRDDILFQSTMIPAGNTEEFTFFAPEEPGTHTFEVGPEPDTVIGEFIVE